MENRTATTQYYRFGNILVKSEGGLLFHLNQDSDWTEDPDLTIGYELGEYVGQIVRISDDHAAELYKKITGKKLI